MKDEALKLALEALELNNDEWKSLADSGDAGVWKAEDQDHYRQTNDAITAIKEALAQPAQEPVAWAVYDILHGGSKTLHWPEQHSPNGDPKQYKEVPLYGIKE